MLLLLVEVGWLCLCFAIPYLWVGARGESLVLVLVCWAWMLDGLLLAHALSRLISAKPALSRAGAWFSSLVRPSWLGSSRWLPAHPAHCGLFRMSSLACYWLASLGST